MHRRVSSETPYRRDRQDQVVGVGRGLRALPFGDGLAADAELLREGFLRKMVGFRSCTSRFAILRFIKRPPLGILSLRKGYRKRGTKRHRFRLSKPQPAVAGGLKRRVRSKASSIGVAVEMAGAGRPLQSRGFRTARWPRRLTGALPSVTKLPPCALRIGQKRPDEGFAGALPARFGEHGDVVEIPSPQTQIPCPHSRGPRRFPPVRRRKTRPCLLKVPLLAPLRSTASKSTRLRAAQVRGYAAFPCARFSTHVPLLF